MLVKARKRLTVMQVHAGDVDGEGQTGLLVDQLDL